MSGADEVPRSAMIVDGLMVICEDTHRLSKLARYPQLTALTSKRDDMHGIEQRRRDDKPRKMHDLTGRVRTLGHATIEVLRAMDRFPIDQATSATMKKIITVRTVVLPGTDMTTNNHTVVLCTDELAGQADFFSSQWRYLILRLMRLEMFLRCDQPLSFGLCMFNREIH